MKLPRKIFQKVAVAAMIGTAFLSAHNAAANGESEPGGPTCIDAGVLSGSLISKTCWDCIYPIVLSGATIAGSKDDIPDGAANINKLGACMCYDNNGVPFFGVRTSLWEPARMIELQRLSGCSSVLGGIRFPFNKLFLGTEDNTLSNPDDTQVAAQASVFKHYHMYTFPLLVMLQMWVPNRCNPGGYMDLDMMYMSEVDPGWNYSEIAFFTHPEGALFANPLGIISCLPDVFGANIGKPIKELFWCNGSWGIMFPTTGHTEVPGILLSGSQLASRALYSLHRRGLEWQSMGKDAMCGGTIAKYFPKTQYRMQVFHPVSESNSNHVIGQTTLLWGTGRTIPVVGEDPVFIIWRWLDCCNTNG